MSELKTPFPSLLDYFDAPDGFKGHFGWIVGFSADKFFINTAAERFTSYTQSQRANKGKIALALFLDPSNKALNWEDVPGVAHLPIAGQNGLKKKGCRLIHAKIALLSFRNKDNPNAWCLRLIVASGNWTRQTVEDSLDLACSIDITSEDLLKASDNTGIACADIQAAHQLFDWLRSGADGLFATDVLNHSAEAQQDADAWVAICKKAAHGFTPRFVDNRSKSILSQLPERISQFSTVSRNYLAMGSGFFEGGELCTVPQDILQVLRQKSLLTLSSETDLFINRTACQSIARSSQALIKEAIIVRPAIAPEALFPEKNERSLHAKFLFSANYRENSNLCSNGWVYLGSANLTKHGFTQRMGPNSGNLEAGVVFSVKNAYWYEKEGAKPHQVITNLLPLQWDTKSLPAEVIEGEPWEAEAPSHFAPPVPWLQWHEAGEVIELRLPEHITEVTEFVILNDAGAPLNLVGKVFQWQGAWRQQVVCNWEDEGEKRQAYIPIMDMQGRLAATLLTDIHDLSDALLELSAFPNPPDDDQGDNEGDASESNEQGTTESSGSSNEGARSLSPIRQMMELIEHIATQQTRMEEHDWHHWCNRLEHTLVRAKTSPTVIYFIHELKLNPLTPLRNAAFMPDYATQLDSKAWKQYQQALKNIEKQWAVSDDLQPLGEQP